VTDRLDMPGPIAALLGEVPPEARPLVEQLVAESVWQLVVAVIAMPAHALEDLVQIYSKGTLPQRAHALARLAALCAAFSRQGCKRMRASRRSWLLDHMERPAPFAMLVLSR
jgi:hypothetical protein